MDNLGLQLPILLVGVRLIAVQYHQWVWVRASAPVRRRPVRTQGTPKATGEVQGVTRKPVCSECAASARPALASKRGRRKTVRTELHYCPNKGCRYYGWLGKGNLRSNGRPNGGHQRQLQCTVCRQYFAESHGTLFYGKRYRPEQLAQILTALAEGLGLRATSRGFGLAPETILAWVSEAGLQLAMFHPYQSRQLEVEQVQLDELYGVIRAYQAGELSEAEAIAALGPGRSSTWLWTAIAPTSKFWLAAVVGERTATAAWQIVHQVAGMLKGGGVPLFITNGNRAYEQPLLSHFGQWQPPTAGQRCPRWHPLPQLLYAQVVKTRRGRRLVSVAKRAVFGALAQIEAKLAASGQRINTAYVERLNLTIRQLVPALGRRVNTLAHRPDALAWQVNLAQSYYNFCLPCRSLTTAGERSRTPATAVGSTDRVWSLQEVRSCPN